MAESPHKNISPEELRVYVDKLREKEPNDVLIWLLGEGNLEAASRQEAFAVEDKVKANRHDDRANWFGMAVKEIATLRTRMDAFKEALVGRIYVALGDAKAPPWQPTHRHYKGTLYRVTGKRDDANGDELVEGVEYDDAAGNRFFLHRSRFEGVIGSGKLRFQPLITGD